MRTKRKTIISLLVCIGIGMMLTGCIGKMTPKKLLKAVSENMGKVSSFSNTVEMDIKLENVVSVTEVSMKMNMEHTTEPRAGHVKGDASLKLRGVELSSSMEVYQVEEDGKQVTYSGMDGVWTKDNESGNSTITLNQDFMSGIGTDVTEFRIADEPVEVQGKECYEMYGDVTGQELMGLLGAEILNAYGLVELPDAEAVQKLKIPVTMDIYKEEKLPARIYIDMTDVMNELFESQSETTDVNDFTIQLEFGEYGKVKRITVPEEVKNIIEKE